MKTDTNLTEINLESFYAFAQLDMIRKTELLKDKGVFLELDMDNEKCTNLYFLNGFFVEETLSRPENKLIEIIPYKRGYRIENYFQPSNVILSKKDQEPISIALISSN